MTPESQLENPTSKLSRFFLRVLIPVSLFVYMAPFIALVFYAPMNKDDYTKAILSTNGCASPIDTHTLGPMVWAYYTKWTGRWLTSIVQGAVMSKLNLITFYGWLLLLVMLATIAALTYFFAKFLRVPYTRALIVGSAFYAVWLASTVRPIEGVYWLTEAFEYHLSLIALLFLAGLLCSPKLTKIGYVGIAVFAFGIPGLHEFAAGIMLPCLVVAVIAARVLKQPTFKWWLALGFAALGFATIVFSPSLTYRLADGHKSARDLAHALPYAKRAFDFGVDWITSPAVLLFALIVPFLIRSRGNAPSENDRMPPRWVALACLGGMCYVVVQFGAIEMLSGYGTFGPRHIGWTQFMFWLFMVSGIVIGLPEISRMKFSPASQLTITALFLVSLFGSGQFHTAVKDLRGPARPWLQANVARLKQRGSSLEFAPLPPKPALFTDAALAAYPASNKCWVNQCMAIYLGADHVVAQDPNENNWGCGIPPK